MSFGVATIQASIGSKANAHVGYSTKNDIMLHQYEDQIKHCQATVLYRIITPKRYVEVLTPRIWSEAIWKWDFNRQSIKMRSVRWFLIQYDWYHYKKKSGHRDRHSQREDSLNIAMCTESLQVQTYTHPWCLTNADLLLEIIIGISYAW